MNLNSTVRFTSNGSVATVDLTYNVQSTDMVQVFFEGEEQSSGWTLNRNSSPQRVTFSTSPPAGAEVLIRRYTDMREVPHEFYQHGDGRGGAEFNAKNLDENFDKIKRAAQDAMDSFELVGINVEAARDAEQYALEAKGYRDTAQTHRNQSETYKNQAETASTDAYTYRQQAANSALQAATSAGDVIDQANLAESYAQSALASKQSADTDAQTAAGAAQAAGADRILAQTARQQAQGYATNASTKATEALQHAGAAQQSAANASVSEGAAYSSEQVAISKAGEATQSAEKAYKWANEDADVPVESGEFSARHWAIKAQDVVQGDSAVHVQDTDSVSWTGDGSVQNPLKATVGEVTWDNLQNKPSEFPPSTHTHDFTTLTNRPAYYPTNWASVSSKPTTFPADPHTHPWSSVTDKPDHFPTNWDSVADKPITFPPDTHSHTWSSITAKPSTFTPSSHSHTWASISGKPSTFSPSSHVHQWSEVYGVPSFVDASVGASGYSRHAVHGQTMLSSAGLSYHGPLSGVVPINPFVRLSGYVSFHPWSMTGDAFTAALTFQWKKSTASAWTTAARTITATMAKNAQGVAPDPQMIYIDDMVGVDVGTSYDFRIRVRTAVSAGGSTLNNCTVHASSTMATLV